MNELLLHTRGSLNAHQNSLSKPRDAFLRCLMGGQIGNHFNKIPLRLNCISQEDQSRAGWNRRQRPRRNLYLPSWSALKRGYLLRRQVYSGRTSRWNARVQKLDCGNAEAGSSLDTRMSVSGSRVCSSSLCEVHRRRKTGSSLCAAIFMRYFFFAVQKTITSRARRRPFYFNYIVPALKPTRPSPTRFHNPFPSQTHTHMRAHQTAWHYTLNIPSPHTM